VHIVIFEALDASMPLVTGFNFLDQTTVYNLTTQIFPGGANDTQTIDMIVSSDGKTKNSLTLSFAVPNTTLTQSAYIAITPSFTDAVATFANSGMIDQCRPVAQSALCTWEGSSLIDGGQLACARVPADALAKNYFTVNPNPAVGNLQNWENLSKLSSCRATNGAIKEGCYGWWAPEETDDYNLYDPEELNDRGMPGIVISGQIPPAPIAGASSFQPGNLRVMIFTLFEATTEETLIPSEQCIGSTAEMEEALRFIASLPPSTKNDGHIDMIKRAFAAMKEFYVKNRGTINSMGMAGLTLAKLGLSLF